MVTVSWQQVCCPKSEAGLGLHHLPDLNKAALLTMCCNMLTASTSWGAFARCRFSISRHMPHRSIGSSIWPGLRVSFPLVFQHSRWIIGDGKSVLFWSDKWLSSSIIDKLHLNPLSQQLRTSVSSFILEQLWALPGTFCHSFPDLSQEILQIPLPLVGESDTLIWENSTYGTLSFSNAFDLVRTRLANKDWVSQIWRAAIPPRLSMLAWRLFNKLPTND